MASLAGQLEVSTSGARPVETKKKKKKGLAGHSEYKQITAQTGLPASARHSLGVIGGSDNDPAPLSGIVRQHREEGA